MKLILFNERPTSWNTLNARLHWKKREVIMKSSKQAVYDALLAAGITPQSKMFLFTQPVNISITAYFKNRPLDSDNICDKPYIDGLREILIRDDSRKYVKKVTTISEIDDKEPRVEIDIEPV